MLYQSLSISIIIEPMTKVTEGFRASMILPVKNRSFTTHSTEVFRVRELRVKIFFDSLVAQCHLSAKIVMWLIKIFKEDNICPSIRGGIRNNNKAEQLNNCEPSEALSSIGLHHSPDKHVQMVRITEFSKRKFAIQVEYMRIKHSEYVASHSRRSCEFQVNKFDDIATTNLAKSGIPRSLWNKSRRMA